MYLKFKYTLLAALFSTTMAFTASYGIEVSLDQREQKIRQRYETMLMEDPFQSRAFDRLFESYINNEGVEAWRKQLETEAVAQKHPQSSLILRGLIYARQFQNNEALKALEGAVKLGETSGQLDGLLGSLYYDKGDDEKAVPLLQSALEHIKDTDERSQICYLLGNVFLRNNKPEQAIISWERIVENNPQDLFSQLELAEIYEENRLWERAIATYQTIINLTTNNNYRKCRALRSIGQCHVRMQAYDQAIVTYEQALELVAPGNWLFEDIKLKLVGVYQDQGNLTGLIDYVEARLKQSPNAIDMRHLLADLHIRLAKFDAAETELNYVIERNPRDRVTLEKLIALHQKTDADDKLIQSYELLIDYYPKQPEYIQRLGVHYMAQENKALALETWQRHVEQADVTARHYLELAHWLEGYEFYTEAIDAYRESIKLKDESETVIQLATLLHAQDQPEEAIRLWLSTLGENASSAEVAGIASILNNHNAYDQAVSLWQRAIELEPENLEYRLQLATVYSIQKKHDLALPIYEYLIAKAPANSYHHKRGDRGQLTTLEKLGLLQEHFDKHAKAYADNPKSVSNIQAYARFVAHMGNKEALVTLHEELVKLEPENPQLIEQLARTHVRNKQFNQAIPLYEQLTTQEPNRAKSHLQSLLNIYLNLNNKDNTIAIAKRMATQSPTDPESRIALAQIYQRHQEPSKALEQYRQAIRIAPEESNYYLDYGSALIEKKRLGEAEVILRKALNFANRDSSRRRALESLAGLYQRQDQLKTLVSEYKAIISETPKRLQAYEDLVTIYEAAHNLPKIIETYELALNTIDEKQPVLKKLIGYCYDMDSYQQATHYYQQLLSLNAKPEPNEYVKLGKIHVLSGELEKAKAVWANVFEKHPNNWEVNQSLARVYQEEGLEAEAIAAKARTVELEPDNYKNRYAYAYMLANYEQGEAALLQLQEILNRGEAIAESERAAKEKKEAQRQRFRRDDHQKFNKINKFLSGLQNFGHYNSPTWQGDYISFRPNLISFMLNMAKISIGEEQLIENFKKQFETNPNNLNAQRDLIDLYYASDRFDQAEPLLKKLLKQDALDSDRMLNQAQVWIKAGKYDAAIELLKKIKDTKPENSLIANIGIVHCLDKQEKHDQVESMIEEVVDAQPDDIMSYLPALQFSQHHDLIIRIIEKLREQKPEDKTYSLNYYIYLCLEANKWDKVKHLISDAFVDAQPQSIIPGQNLKFHTLGNEYGRSWVSNSFKTVPRELVGLSYWLTLKILEYIDAGIDDPEKRAIWDQLVLQAEIAIKTKNNTRISKSWSNIYSVFLRYDKLKQNEAIDTLFQPIIDLGLPSQDLAIMNTILYHYEQRKDYARLENLYRDIWISDSKYKHAALSSLMTLSIIQEDLEQADKYWQILMQGNVLPQEIVNIQNALFAIGATKRAISYGEHYLKSHLRSDAVLEKLSELYATNSQYDQAIELGWEAWTRKNQGQQYNPNRYISSRTFFNSRSDDELITSIEKHYSKAGRKEEFNQKLEALLTKYPTSFPLVRQVAEAYRNQSKLNKAIETYEKYLKLRPQAFQVKGELSKLYTRNKQYEKAVALQKALIAKNASIYDRINRDMATAFKALGKQDELEAIQNKLSKKAKNPDELRKLASQYNRQKKYEQADELYQRAINLDPQDTWLLEAHARNYKNWGKPEKAYAIYLKINSQHLKNPNSNSNSGGYFADDIVELASELGKLDSLILDIETYLKENPGNYQAQLTLLYGYFQNVDLKKVVAIVQELNSHSSADVGHSNILFDIARLTGPNSDITGLIVKSSGGSSSPPDEHQIEYYLANGAIDEARKEIEESIGMSSGRSRSAVRDIYHVANIYKRYQLWDEYEALLIDHRKEIVAGDEEYRAKDMRAFIADAFVNHGALRNFISKIWTRKNLSVADVEILLAIYDEYQKQKQQDKAQALLKRLIEHQPGNEVVMAKMAEFYTKQEEHTLALEWISKLRENWPKNQSYFYQHIDTLFALEQYDTAWPLLREHASEQNNAKTFKRLYTYEKNHGNMTHAVEAKKRELSFIKNGGTRNFETSKFTASLGDTASRQKFYNGFSTKLGGKHKGRFWDVIQFFQKHGQTDKALALAEEHQELLKLTEKYNTISEIPQLGFRTGNHTFVVDQIKKDWPEIKKWNRRRTKTVHHNAFKANSKVAAHLILMTPLFLNDTQTKEEDKLAFINDYISLGLNGFAKDSLTNLNLVGENPSKDAQEMKLNVLQNLGELNAAAQEIEASKALLKPDGYFEQQLNLLKAYLRAKQFDDAHALATSMLSWAPTAKTHKDIGMAYMEHAVFDQALDYLKHYIDNITYPAPYDVLISIARCHLMLGDDAQGFAMLETICEYPDHKKEFQETATWLIEQQQFEQAILVQSKHIGRLPDDLNGYKNLANIWQVAARFDILNQAVEKAYKQFNDSEEKDWASVFKEALTTELFTQAVQAYQATSANYWIKPLIHAFKFHSDNDDIKRYAHMHAETFARLNPNTAKLSLALALAFEALDKKSIAKSFFQKVLSYDDTEATEAAAWGLVRIGEVNLAKPHLVGKTYPISHFANQPDNIKAFCQIASPEAIQAALQNLDPLLFNADHKTVYTAWFDYYQGNTDTAWQRIEALAEKNILRKEETKRIAEFCKDNERTDLAIRFYQSIIDRHLPHDEQQFALRQLVELNYLSGNYSKSFAHLVRIDMSSNTLFNDSVQLWLFERMRAEAYSALEAAITTFVQNRPWHDNVSQLLWLLDECAEKVEQPSPLASILAQVELPPHESYEVEEAINVIEGWEISPSYPFYSKQSMLKAYPPELEVLEGDNTSPKVTWQSVSPKTHRGDYNFIALSKSNTIEAQNKLAYARTTLESDRDKQVILSIGSDDMFTLWLNGKKVSEHTDYRAAGLGQNLVLVELKAGQNELLFKVGSGHAKWGFSVSVIEENFPYSEMITQTE